MKPTSKQLKTYYSHAIDNYQTLIDMLQTAHTDLNAILSATDPPESKNHSLIELFVDTALFVVAPEAWAFVKANKVSKATETLMDHAESLARAISAAKGSNDQAKAIIDAKSKVEGWKGDATLGMIRCVKEMVTRFTYERSLALLNLEGFQWMLSQNSKVADALFDFIGIDWTKPPELLGLKADDILYAFEYALVSRAVEKFVKLKIKVAYTDSDHWSTNDLIVAYEPEGISQKAMGYIFDTFTRPLGKSNFTMPGGRSGQRIVRVTNYEEMAKAWTPDVYLSGVPVYSGVRTNGDKLAEIFITLDRFRRGLNADGSTPKGFHWWTQVYLTR